MEVERLPELEVSSLEVQDLKRSLEGFRDSFESPPFGYHLRGH